jgi:hypothetical protein
MLDVEKWWSLVLVQAKARETAVQWSATESQARLEDVLYTPMQVRLTREELPHVTPVALQTLIREWSFHEHEAILRQKVNQLFALRVRAPQELAVIVEQYRAVLDAYLGERTSKKLAERSDDSRQVRALMENVLTTLNALDQRRAMSGKPAPNLARSTEAAPSPRRQAPITFDSPSAKQAR